MVKNYNFGISLKLLNLLFFTSSTLLFLSLKTSIPTFQIFFLISVTGLAIMFPWLLVVKEERLKVKSYKLYAYRALCNIMGMVSWVEALKYISLNEAYSIDYMTAIFTTILAVLFCNEKLSLKSFIILLISSFGVYIIISSDYTVNLNDGTTIGVFATFMWSCYNIICKLQSSEDIVAQTFYTFLFTVILSLPIALFIWKPITYDELSTIPVLAFLTIFSSITLFSAYKSTPIVILMPFTFSKVLFIEFGMYIFFEDAISKHALIGIIIILIAMGYFFHQQYKGKVSH
ncbi:hypothetical protein I862_05105 [endosymbiont of Acanthamoeba sp. UWC8]|uniref:DMT family transporter n=1 Tax=endosymbiont of Acanthamoeba sp. UWC8 TaxID=86106 RepID=UPI0004D1ACB9|nr:DMT family transporter [endosymbiont of Acanthamoeba sp. UWC8]AIF81577.1 hypothetical protein I862_05105 [endosymbiont of Acanthamoeba sp. UWC8]